MTQERLGYPYVHLFSVHSGRRLVIYLTGSGPRSKAMHDQEITYNLDAPLGIIPWVARNGQSVLANDVISTRATSQPASLRKIPSQS